MRLVGLVAIAACVLSACGTAKPEAVASSSPSSYSPSPVASPSARPSSSPPAIPAIACGARPTGGPTVLLGRAPAPLVLYDVSDPVHPRLLCRLTYALAHLYTGDAFTYLRPTGGNGTEVDLHSLGSGNESAIASVPYPGLGASYTEPTAWTADGTVVAHVIQPIDLNDGSPIQVWLYSQRDAGNLYSYPLPAADCLCRFGLPPPTLAFSADGQYLVSGWPIGQRGGGAALAVYRVSDRTLVKTLDATSSVAIWDRTGHRLYVSDGTGTKSWTPEAGFATLPGAGQWTYLAGLSPDGRRVAYTGYAGAGAQQQLRVYVYNFEAQTTRLLVDVQRSQVVFVRDGVVWYLEEAPCDTSGVGCGPWGTGPTGKVFAMDLAAGVERQVTFASGEEPFNRGGQGFTIAPGEFWPNS